MEFLIPGLILVALMVYASTRIKRVAAEAFEPETVENDDFSLEKPEGFLVVLNGDPALAFEAYSRDFGIDRASEYRAARAEIRIYENRDLKYAAAAIRETIKIDSDISEVIDGKKYRVLEGMSEEKGIAFREMFKLAERDGKVIEMKLRVLAETDSEVSGKAEAMFASFALR
jgi:hypothetical protein